MTVDPPSSLFGVTWLFLVVALFVLIGSFLVTTKSNPLRSLRAAVLPDAGSTVPHSAWAMLNRDKDDGAPPSSAPPKVKANDAMADGEAADEEFDADLPSFLRLDSVRAAIETCGAKEVSQSTLVASVHRVRCESAGVVAQVQRWAAQAGFQVEAPVRGLGTGSDPYYELELVHRAEADCRRIQRRGRQVVEAIEKISGARYETLMIHA